MYSNRSMAGNSLAPSSQSTGPGGGHLFTAFWTPIGRIDARARCRSVLACSTGQFTTRGAGTVSFNSFPSSILRSSAASFGSTHISFSISQNNLSLFSSLLILSHRIRPSFQNLTNADPPVLAQPLREVVYRQPRQRKLLSGNNNSLHASNLINMRA